MRPEDQERLSRRYDPIPVGEQGDPSHLGVHSDALDALESEILADFVLEPPHGIGWWAPNPGASRRILISDQLYACVQSVATNLTEAAIHWLEFQDYSERESDFLADAVRIRGGRVEVRARARVSPWEDVMLEMVDVHLVGTVRALAGARWTASPASSSASSPLKQAC